ncbi:hypothetical protein ETI11_01430 [Macrococcoides canis]|uniref:Uncharacterized protein n=1 Tax=Macrococcus psychrotolerans TaxID=3039389 RepID=A0AAT9P3U3_9STAP|nr:MULTISPECIES: hypothetical protein [Macrococcus]QYA31981.1 hypothetical protein KYI10_06160 [Macrococcus sp. 19Msa1099]QYA36787.1 hypothetical protein KYI07_06150 [Macrococcus caseolyticus]QYA75495.1 hypothetical protein KYI12_06150 [Macrococcus caseolyticus]TDM38082.1 hypothetical protein ETI11_01430 [Macrococcus canis]
METLEQHQSLIDGTVAYMNIMPLPDYINEVPSEDLPKYLFSAIQDIKDYFPGIELNPRMVYLQLDYKLEAEEEGFGVLKRHNVEDYTVKDVKVVFNHEKLSPSLLAIIDGILAEERKTSLGRTGRLI